MTRDESCSTKTQNTFKFYTFNIKMTLKRIKNIYLLNFKVHKFGKIREITTSTIEHTSFSKITTI